MKLKKLLHAKGGLTLVEVLVASAIFAFCLAGLLLSYINLFVMTDVARDTTIATNALQSKLEEIKGMSFTAVDALHNTTFDVTDSNFLVAGSPMVIGKGRIELTTVADPFTNATYSDLKEARVVVSYKSRTRVFGEDANLNGQLDTGEDDSRYFNGAGMLNSPVEGITLIKNFTNTSS